MLDSRPSVNVHRLAQLRKALREFAQAAENLSEAWDSTQAIQPDVLSVLAEQYPFGEDFGQINLRTQEWARQAIEELHERNFRLGGQVAVATPE